MTNLALGAAIDFTGVELPFSVGDLLSSASALVGWVGPFVLLGIAFIFAPRIIGFIKGAITKNRNAA